MQYNQIFPLLKQKTGTLILGGILVAALSFFFLVVSQKNFKVGTDFLVVQDKDGAQDYYSLFKSSEYIGRVLGEAIYSDLFVNEMIKTGKINEEFLPFDKKSRLREWNKIISVKRNPEVSMLSVTVYGNNREDTLKISEGITEVLTTKSYLFRGSGQNIDVRVLSGPIVEKNPDLPDIILVMIGGFIVGALISIVWLFYRLQNNISKFVLYTGKNKGESGSITTFPEPDEYEESLRYLDNNR